MTNRFWIEMEDLEQTQMTGFGVRAYDREQAISRAWSRMPEIMREDGIAYNRNHWKVARVTQFDPSFLMQADRVCPDEVRVVEVQASNREEAKRLAEVELGNILRKEGKKYDPSVWWVRETKKDLPVYLLQMEDLYGAARVEIKAKASNIPAAKRIAWLELRKALALEGKTSGNGCWKFGEVTKDKPLYTAKIERLGSLGLHSNIEAKNQEQAERMAWAEIERELRDQGEEFVRRHWRMRVVRDDFD